MTKLLFVLALFTACGSSKKNRDDEDRRGPRESNVSAAANANGIDARILLTAAYVQSNFGTELAATEKIPGVTRTTPFGLFGNATGGAIPQDLAANSRTIAKSIHDRAIQVKPANPFDWLRITSQVIASALDSSPLAALQTSIVLNELISAYNEGFSSAFVDGEVITVAPSPTPIDIAKLDAARKVFLSPPSTLGSIGEIVGPGDAEAGDKMDQEFPTIVLRWCASSAIVCFDHLRYTVESPAHFMLYKGASGERKVIRFHPTGKDLLWYGQPASNVISIVITGLSGDKPENYRYETLDWKNYVGSAKVVHDVMQAVATTMSSATLGNNWGKFIVEESLTAPAIPTLAMPPQGKPTFAIPSFWDGAFFREILAADNASLTNSISETSNNPFPTFPGTTASFAFKVAPEVAQLTYFADSTTTDGWDFIRRSSIKEGGSVPPFQDDFSLPSKLANGQRALRVVARNNAGQPVGMWVSRFRLAGLK